MVIAGLDRQVLPPLGHVVREDDGSARHRRGYSPF
jgi:hypothetical protein